MLVRASDGWGYFFLTCSPILDWGIFHKWFCQLYYKLCPSPKITPTIRCCEQHLMVGVVQFFFFLTCSPILDLGHFSQVILPIVLQIMPQLSGAVHSIWWLGFSFYLFSHSGLRAFFTDDFANCTTVYAQPSGAVHSIWWLGLFFLTCSPILDLGHFSQVILPIVLQIMPQPKNNPNHQVLWTASDGWG